MPFLYGKIHFCSRLFCCILTGVFCLGDFRRLTHFDAHQRRLYFGFGLPSQTYASINSHRLARAGMKKNRTILYSFDHFKCWKTRIGVLGAFWNMCKYVLKIVFCKITNTKGNYEDPKGNIFYWHALLLWFNL